MKRIYKLTPLFRDYLWGGTKLAIEFGYKTGLETVAEAWLLSGHESDSNNIVNETDTVRDLAKRYKRELLGTKSVMESEFPLLIKLIDAQQHLSVQVHPDDYYAQEIGEAFGKTEMWYIVDTEADNAVIYGPKDNMSKQQLQDAIDQKTLESKLNYAPVTKGDSVFIEAGTIHAIQSGTTILEVQQSSDTTYRLYDYNREDKDGNKRDLHIEESLKVSNLNRLDPEFRRESINVGDHEITQLESCQYFDVSKVTINGEYKIQTDRTAFISLVILEGEGEIESNNESISFKKGDSLLLPAQNADYVISGISQVIKTTL